MKLIDIDSVTQNNVCDMHSKLCIWLKNQVHANGRMLYKYNVDQRQESRTNNVLRQLMASWALTKIDTKLSKLNLDYNLKKFYYEKKDLGIIENGTTVKLGALAMAGLALQNYDGDNFNTQLQYLVNTIKTLWQDNGEFKTYYKPHTNKSNRNFYPGEALLLLSILDPTNPKLKTSFNYYKQWHLKNRNPAFIPWHTQAYYFMWKSTKDQELIDFIFQMNDWLLHIQQWDKVEDEYIKGRFYKDIYGPPHASSTGVYIDGLAYALELAQLVKDNRREYNYSTAIKRGLRSLMQLQYDEPGNMRLHGGIRATVKNSCIRVDNVQHAFMAVNKVLDVFNWRAVSENLANATTT